MQKSYSANWFTLENWEGIFFMRDSVIIYRSFYEAIKTLTLENQGLVWGAIFEYSINFKTVPLEGFNLTIFNLIKPQLDSNIKKYHNGKAPKTLALPPNKKATNKQTVSKPEANGKQTVSKPEANDNDNVNDNVNDNENGGKQKFSKPTVQEIQEFCLSRKNDVDPVKFFNFYESKGWMVGKNPMKNWKSAVITWEKPKDGQNEVQVVSKQPRYVN